MVREMAGIGRNLEIPAAIPTPTPKNTCAIVITYNPDTEFKLRVQQVLAQFARVFIVDNGSANDARAMLSTVAEDGKVCLLSNAANLGIAQALNQGMSRALQEGFVWAVTLDQDTLVFADMLETLIAVHADCGLEQVLVGGNYLNVNKQRNFIDCKRDRERYRERKTLITAGTLIPLDMATRIGGFRSDYFIDSVDHEFCLRARANGFKVIISCKPVMSQSIGSGIVAGSMLSRFASFNHSPVRKYYIARNTLVTARDYFFDEPAWALRQMWRLLSDFISILLFEKGKFTKARAFLLGIIHGLGTKMGPMNTNQDFLGKSSE